MKVAVVHEWLTTYGGAERVVAAILAEYPQADLFCLVDFMSPADRERLGAKQVFTSFLQRIPLAAKLYRSLLPIMPLAIEQFDLSAYDVVISSSHAVAKGVITGPDQLHICYCHTPSRYAWDLQPQYLRSANLERGFKSWIARWLLHRFRIWDSRTAAGVDHFIANSNYIARRIWKTYRRESTVIFPGVDVRAFHEVERCAGEIYLTWSRLVPYKKIELIVDAFRHLPERKLVVIGGGTQAGLIADLAGPNVELMGYQDDAAVRAQLARAKAFIFAAEEDFGIAPVEAQAAGVPVIAFGRGGATETVRDGVTGVLFHEQSAEAIAEAVRRFEALGDRFDPGALRAHADQFSEARFRRSFTAFLAARWNEHVEALDPGRRRRPAAVAAVKNA